MLTIGCHLSSAKGYLAMGKMAKTIEANTFQFFTRNPRGGSVKPLDLEDMAQFIDFAKKEGLRTILAHAPYTMNACSADAGLREFAKRMMLEDLERLEHLPDVMYNFHPGSHVKQGVEVGIAYITQMLAEVLAVGGKTPILLETMAGKGSEIGSRFEEMREIIDRLDGNPRMGVCLDTCHVYDAGYDIVENLDGVLEAFDRIVGLERLKAIHLNDSKNPMGSHKDRHEQIGAGAIGIGGIERVVRHPKLRHLPFYLETPQDELAGYGREIAMLRNM